MGKTFRKEQRQKHKDRKSVREEKREQKNLRKYPETITRKYD